MTRIEDRRLLTGKGCYVDDIHLPQTLHMAVLRSPAAAAVIEAVDAAAARACPGVADVLVAADLQTAEIPVEFSHPGMKASLPFRILAADRVRYVGEPVAAVVGHDRYVAEDAFESISVAYAFSPAVASVEAALAPGAPLVHDHLPDNVAGAWRYQTGDAAQAFARAAVTAAVRLRIARGHANPMETRGCLARFDADSGRLTVWAGHQAPHRLRASLAQVCGLAPEQVRVICPDIGGAFGLKGRNYPEYYLAALFAIRTGRPVKWIEDRREHMLAGTADREVLIDLELAATEDGEVLGLRAGCRADLGAYTPTGLLTPERVAEHMAGPYRIRNIDIAIEGVLSHRPPIGPYRGNGRPTGAYAIERAMDRLAQTLGLDPAAVRQRNLIGPDEMPWPMGIALAGGPPAVYDSGDYPRLLEQVLRHLDYPALRREQAAMRSRGRYVGLGIACFVEGNAGGPEEVHLKLEPSGRLTLATGATNLGQGAGHTWAALAARELGVSPEQIAVVSGDTAAVPSGRGTFGSRTAVVVGNGTVRAAAVLAAKIRAAAGQALECLPEDIELVDGMARVRGAPGAGLPLAELAQRAAAGQCAPEPLALEAKETFAPTGQVWSAGVAAAVVEVDAATAQIKVSRLVVADDCGTILEPALVDGQIVGAAAQAVGGAFYEQLAYNEDGQLLTTTLMDYLLPTACEVPPVEILHAPALPSPTNPLGAKGAGEGGCIGTYAALAGALEDALSPLAITIDELPVSPDRVFGLMTAAGAARS